jgi:RimJ/RimL family protein N-acetyltransferase
VSNRTQAEGQASQAWIVLKRLPDGAPILIRPIRADDKRMLEDGLRQLSDESVHRRFLSPKSSFSRTELRYLTEVDGRDHVALVAEYPGHPVRRLIAVGRFVRLHGDPEVADVAIVVADDWQRRGLGLTLGDELVAEARRLGIRRFSATMASDNVPAHKLMKKLTTRLESHHAGSGVDELLLELAAA